MDLVRTGAADLVKTYPQRVRFRDVLISRLPGIGRYTAGPRVVDAVRKMEDLSKTGIGGIANILGEHDHDPAIIQATISQYGLLMRGIAEAGLQKPNAAVSLKPTQFGLDHSKTERVGTQQIMERMLEINEIAHNAGIFVWYDMENRNTTDFTLELYQTARARRFSSGIAIQANLRRSEQDLRELIRSSEEGVPVQVRLIRGIYNEPVEVAYVGREDMHRSFARLMRMAFSEKAPNFKISIGTHHPEQIIRALALAREYEEKLYDFQFLLGAVSDIPEYLKAAGYPCTYYIPAGPRFLDYGLRRVRENPGGFWGLITAPFRERKNLNMIVEFAEGKLAVDTNSEELQITRIQDK